MTGNRFTLSSIAFGVSFGITLGLSRGDFLGAIGSGSLTFLSSQIGCIIASRQPIDSDDGEQLEWRIEEVRGHIRSLQSRRAEAYDALTQIFQQRDRASETLRALQSQVQQLQSRTHPTSNTSQSTAPSWNLSIPSRRRTMTELQSSEATIKNSEAQITSLEREEADLTRSLSATLATQQRAELQLNSTNAELNQLIAQVAEQKAHKTEIIEEITQLETERQSIKKELAESTEPVGDQVRSVSVTESLQMAVAQLQDQISSLHGELETLETQILDRRTQKNTLDLELLILRSQEPRLDATWAKFATLLPDYEIQALIAIAHHANPAQHLKQIAEANLILPQLLIDRINDRALEAIGDIILEPSDQPGVPIIAQEYKGAIQAILSAYDRTQTAQF